ncbi:uncharacterized protein LOC129914362 [Episyrphus balteatus]|uniref:uncharacterized protein LOC129914362 n=1 Tax=Episyrphus balteatus TaxID=286459 RepID=UPI002486312A|nr:uncharacterized protein LOC129914362 [Episyrphus balteatus]
MPSFITSEMEKVNLKFIELVKKHECIWNRDDKDYNQRAPIEEAWNKIAKETGDTPKMCHSHWQRIRRAYSRSFRINPYGSYQKHKYYLAKALEFVRPHIKYGCELEADNGNKDKISNDTDDSHASVTENEIKDEPYDSDDDTASTSQNVEQILYEIIKMEDENESKDTNESDPAKSPSNKRTNVEMGNENESGHTTESEPAKSPNIKRIKVKDSNEEKNTKETNEIDKDVHPNSRLIEANRKFFESLIPFVDEMNAQQNRRFRRELMCLVDDVLDDRDLNEEK